MLPFQATQHESFHRASVINNGFGFSFVAVVSPEKTTSTTTKTREVTAEAEVWALHNKRAAVFLAYKEKRPEDIKDK